MSFSHPPFQIPVSATEIFFPSGPVHCQPSSTHHPSTTILIPCFFPHWLPLLLKTLVWRALSLSLLTHVHLPHVWCTSVSCTRETMVHITSLSALLCLVAYQSTAVHFPVLCITIPFTISHSYSKSFFTMSLRESKS